MLFIVQFWFAAAWLFFLHIIISNFYLKPILIYRNRNEKHIADNSGKDPRNVNDVRASTIIRKSDARDLRRISHKVTDENQREVFETKEPIEAIHVENPNTSDRKVQVVRRYIRFGIDDNDQINHLEPPSKTPGRRIFRESGNDD